jgi:hypothetical protein
MHIRMPSMAAKGSGSFHGYGAQRHGWGLSKSGAPLLLQPFLSKIQVGSQSSISPTVRMDSVKGRMQASLRPARPGLSFTWCRGKACVLQAPHRSKRLVRPSRHKSAAPRYEIATWFNDPLGVKEPCTLLSRDRLSTAVFGVRESRLRIPATAHVCVAA